MTSAAPVEPTNGLANGTPKIAPKTAIVLAGHGSHITAATAGVVWNQVDILRKMGVADEVTAAFWKESPSFHEVLKTLSATDITIVPMFTAHGYFTQMVIPAEMGLHGALTMRDGRTIRYTRTLGDHPHIADIVQAHVRQAIGEASADQVAVAILGHSTKRNPESRKATEAQVAHVQAAGLASEVIALFLDDTPGIEQVYELTSAPIIVAVPYFLAPGSHATIDVPARLGLPVGTTRGDIQGRTVIYTAPVGEDALITQMILDLAREAGSPLHEARSGGSPWQGFPMVGRAELWQAVRAAKTLTFGQLELTPFEVHPLLTVSANSALDSSTPGQCLPTPGALRKHVRSEPLRPLATSDDLLNGWYSAVNSPDQLHAIVETVYPGLVADWAAAAQNTFVANNLETVAARQSGMYRELAALTPTQRAEVVDRVCGHCVRHPSWFDGQVGALPCAEPCNVWLSTALSLLENTDESLSPVSSVETEQP